LKSCFKTSRKTEKKKKASALAPGKICAADVEKENTLASCQCASGKTDNHAGCNACERIVSKGKCGGNVHGST
jgi:hypothetical protein